MYTSNALARIAEKLEERLHEVHNMIEADHDSSEMKLKETFEPAAAGRQLGLLQAVLSPDLDGGDFMDKLVAHENLVKRYETVAGETIGDAIRTAIPPQARAGADPVLPSIAVKPHWHALCGTPCVHPRLPGLEARLGG